MTYLALRSTRCVSATHWLRYISQRIAILPFNTVTYTTLLDFCTNAAPVRHIPRYKMHPDSHRLANQELLRDCPYETAILAAIAVVTHDEVLPVRHDIGIIARRKLRVGYEDVMHATIQVLNEQRGIPGIIIAR